MLDGDDVSKLVECAVRHPAPNKRSAVLRRSGTTRKRFGRLFSSVSKHPSAFSEIREAVAEELGNHSAPPRSRAPGAVKRAVEPLLPRMPLPAHPRDRERH